MKLRKKDFIELEFTGRVKDGKIFDSNIEKDLKKINPDGKAKPFILSLGQGMFLKGIEDFLIGKDIGDYEVNLSPEEAFGRRDAKLIQRIPASVFKEHDLKPIPGIVFNFDGRIGKVLAASGGRIMVDFNNPIAGKDVVYKIRALRKVEKLEEKVQALMDFLFRQEFKFEIKDKKLMIYVDKKMIKFIEVFKDKFKEVLDLTLDVVELGEKKEKTPKKSQ